MAQQYYDMLMAIQVKVAEAYAANNVREIWKWASWLYDNIYPVLTKKERAEYEKRITALENSIYASDVGDEVKDLHTDDLTSLDAFRQQMSDVRRFYRDIQTLMQEKKMVLPWTQPRDLGRASLEMD